MILVQMGYLMMCLSRFVSCFVLVSVFWLSVLLCGGWWCVDGRMFCCTSRCFLMVTNVLRLVCSATSVCSGWLIVFVCVVFLVCSVC